MSIFIPQEEYFKILNLMPIVCVDIVVYSKTGFLLIKRNVEPAKDCYWLPGGRLMKGEHSEKAVSRILKTELGMHTSGDSIYELGFDETVFNTGPNNIPVHSVNIVYLCENKTAGGIQLSEIKVGEYEREPKFFTGKEVELSSYCKRWIDEARAKIAGRWG